MIELDGAIHFLRLIDVLGVGDGGPGITQSRSYPEPDRYLTHPEGSLKSYTSYCT
jgi:hypothetical protein